MNRNNALKKLVLAALFVALDLLFTRVFCIYLMGGAERVSLQTLASAVCGWALGPWWSAGVAAAADLLGSAIGSSGLSFFPGFTLCSTAGADLWPAAVPQTCYLPSLSGRQRCGKYPVGAAAQFALAFLLYGQEFLGMDSCQGADEAFAGAGICLSDLSDAEGAAKKRTAGTFVIKYTRPSPRPEKVGCVCFFMQAGVRI